MNDNLLIADFMEVDITPVGLRRNVMQKSYYESELKYHLSYDWLMPVVEKIEALGFVVKSENDLTTIEDPRFNNIRLEKPIKDGNYKRWDDGGNRRLCGLYHAIVQFINWHNEQLNEKEALRLNH